MPTILLALALQTQVTGSIFGIVTDTGGKPLGYRATDLEQVVEAGRRLHMDFELHAMVDQTTPLGSVFGVVRDTAGHAVATASVILQGLSRSTATDSLGRYHFDSVPAGPVVLLVRRIGSKGVRADTTVVAGHRLSMDFVIQYETLRLAPVCFCNESAMPIPSQR